MSVEDMIAKEGKIQLEPITTVLCSFIILLLFHPIAGTIIRFVEYDGAWILFSDIMNKLSVPFPDSFC
jgi:hypothetical protein